MSPCTRTVSLLAFFFLITISFPGLGHAQARASIPDVVLEGTVTGSQNKTYIEVPFNVPPGVHRISVDFNYTGKDQKTALDLGIRDPERFRGTSGGGKSHFTISETDATPSYLPGAIPAGTWKMLLAVPNIRAQVTSQYHAVVHFNPLAEDAGFASTALAQGKRWYRGDLHMHTAHSDGTCASEAGKRVPCPLFLTVETAASRGLDFIAITDHNTDSHYNEMRELQPYFDKLLLIPGREITTFWGHFNVYGVTQFIDYRVLTGADARDVNAVLRDVIARGGIASVNHADSPGGEVCMGCAWEPTSAVDMRLFTGVEVINGGRDMMSSADFWDRQLSAGNELTAIGGSDNHNAPSTAGEPGSIGTPTTVVEATELSLPAILDGIRHGRVFIDLTSSHDKTIDLDARAGVAEVRMGGALTAAKGETIDIAVHVTASATSSIRLLVDGQETATMPPMTAKSADDTLGAHWISDGAPHWLRAEVRDSQAKLMLLSNPIYINYTSR